MSQVSVRSGSFFCASSAAAPAAAASSPRRGRRSPGGACRLLHGLVLAADRPVNEPPVRHADDALQLHRRHARQRAHEELRVPVRLALDEQHLDRLVDHAEQVRRGVVRLRRLPGQRVDPRLVREQPDLVLLHPEPHLGRASPARSASPPAGRLPCRRTAATTSARPPLKPRPLTRTDTGTRWPMNARSCGERRSTARSIVARRRRSCACRPGPPATWPGGPRRAPAARRRARCGCRRSARRPPAPAGGLPPARRPPPTARSVACPLGVRAGRSFTPTDVDDSLNVRTCTSNWLSSSDASDSASFAATSYRVPSAPRPRRPARSCCPSRRPARSAAACPAAAASSRHPRRVEQHAQHRRQRRRPSAPPPPPTARARSRPAAASAYHASSATPTTASAIQSEAGMRGSKLRLPMAVTRASRSVQTAIE